MMLRIVPVGRAIYPELSDYQNAFAFFSTSSDQFIMFQGDQVWKDWSEFEEVYRESTSSIPLSRFKALYDTLEIV